MEDNNQNRFYKIYKTIMLIFITAFITFLITSICLYTYYENNGIYIATSEESSSTLEQIEEVIRKVRSVIDEEYLWNDSIDEDALIDAAVMGYVEGLGDEYTEYIPASEVEEFTEEITGTFVGIGIYMIANEEEGIVVYYPIPDSPAEQAGIEAGDIIKSVDGVEYGYEDFDTIADNIKGEKGTTVTLVIERDGEEMEFVVTRETINTNPITTEILEENIGYVNLPSFDDGTAQSFKEKVQELVDEGCTSLIIDLRNNGGGILNETTEIADYFLEKNATIITTKDNEENEEMELSENDKTFDLPLVILVNENSASASEVLCGALQDNNIATIVGTQTYGKGVIQTVISLSNGASLKLTTAEYYTPNGNAINGVGITPDVEVELSEDVDNIYLVDEEDDSQLQKAIEILTN